MKPRKLEDPHVVDPGMDPRRQNPPSEQPGPNPTERRFLRVLHWMRCPKCGNQLATERLATVELEVCPNCQGIWLDANELDTILAAEGASCAAVCDCCATAPTVASRSAQLPSPRGVH